MLTEAAIAFLDQWRDQQSEFIIHSSGSTGEPKPFVLKREWMEWSAKVSGEIFKPTSTDRLFCCLPINKVGGLMMLVRSETWGIPVDVVEPSSNPLLTNNAGTIISLTPYQLHHILSQPDSFERLYQYREVLIGGASLNPELELTLREFPQSTVFRHSYGMTETYSHVALRTINGAEASDFYKPLKDVRIEQSIDHCAIVYTPYYPEGLHTNDIIELDEQGRFKIIGRADFIINTGGVKISAEQVENMISEHLKPSTLFVISSKPDTILGEQVVLVCTNRVKFREADWSFLDQYSHYAIPKEVYEINDMPINKSGKIDRLKVKEWFRKID